MSTKLIRSLIEAHRQGTQVSTAAICEAEREVDAIEQAAKDAAYLDSDQAANRWWEAEDVKRWERVNEVLSSIVTNAP